MVVSEYAAQRSALAHASGLGEKRKSATLATAPAPEPAKLATETLRAAKDEAGGLTIGRPFS